MGRRARIDGLRFNPRVTLKLDLPSARRLPVDQLMAVNYSGSRRTLRDFKFPDVLLRELMDAGQLRTYASGARLRGISGSNSSTYVHFLINGIVSERRVYGNGSTLRFRGPGEILGDLEVFDEEAQPASAVCLAPTWTLSIPLERMRALAEHHILIMMALGKNIAERMQRNERVYSAMGLSAEQRVCTLLHQLALDCGKPATNGGVSISGPSQSDLAEALMLSRATVENVVRSLRKDGLLLTRHRAFAIPNLNDLKVRSSSTSQEERNA